MIISNISLKLYLWKEGEDWRWVEERVVQARRVTNKELLELVVLLNHLAYVYFSLKSFSQKYLVLICGNVANYIC